MQTLVTYPQIQVIGVADKERKRAQELAAKHNVKAYRSPRALLADPTIHLVVNLTIHQAHKKVITQCLEAGKHVHSEKPLALKYTEWGRAALDMAEAISQNRPHRATGERAAHVVEICCAAHQSAKRNKPVEIHSTFTPPAPMEWAI